MAEFDVLNACAFVCYDAPASHTDSSRPLLLQGRQDTRGDVHLVPRDSASNATARPKVQGHVAGRADRAQHARRVADASVFKTPRLRRLRLTSLQRCRLCVHRHGDVDADVGECDDLRRVWGS